MKIAIIGSRSLQIPELEPYLPKKLPKSYPEVRPESIGVPPNVPKGTVGN